MTKNLSKADLAYNACIVALNEIELKLGELMEQRNRLAAACESLCPLDLCRQYKVVLA